MHLAVIKYSVLRLALFVGSLALLWAVGVRQSILMLGLAALISLALSYLLLAKQRDAVATGLSSLIEGRLERRAGIGQADADEEDAAIARREAQLPAKAEPQITAQGDGVPQSSDRQADR